MLPTLDLSPFREADIEGRGGGSCLMIGSVD